MASLASCSISSQGSVRSSEGYDCFKKYILLRDTVAKSKWTNASSKTRLRSKRSEQRVLKGSLWQELEEDLFFPPQHLSKLQRSNSSTSPSAPFKLRVESLEIEDLTLQCASGFLSEISDELCRLLLAIPTSEERYLVHTDQERMKCAKFINVGSDVTVNKRNVESCRAVVRWKGRLAGKQGVWFGVEIVDDAGKGSGDSDGSINNIRLFTCEKNNGMFVNIGQLNLVPPKRPMRKPKRKVPSTPSQGSELLTNGSHVSDSLANDLVSRTESELSFTDDMRSADTEPLVDLEVNDRVLWPSDHGMQPATVRWIGTLPEEELHGEILVGVEFDNAIGKGTGVYKNRRLFEARKGHASLVPLDGLMKITPSPSPSAASSSSRFELSHPNADVTAAAVLKSIGIADEDNQDLNNNGHDDNGRRLGASTSTRVQRLSPPVVTSGNIRNLPGHRTSERSASSQASLSSSDNLTCYSNELIVSAMTSPDIRISNRTHNDISAGDTSKEEQLQDSSYHEKSDVKLKKKNGLIDMTEFVVSEDRLKDIVSKITHGASSEKRVLLPAASEPSSNLNGQHDHDNGDAGRPEPSADYTSASTMLDSEDKPVSTSVDVEDEQTPNCDETDCLQPVKTSAISISDSFSETPEPPPQFLGGDDDAATLTTDSQAMGIQGCDEHSSFMECILYIFSVSTELLFKGEMPSEYNKVKHFLLQDITKPLLKDEMVSAAVMAQWRQMIDELSLGQRLHAGSQRDVQKFLRLVLEHVCHVSPLYELNNHQTGFTLSLLPYRDARIGFPTLQKLLEKTFIQQQIRLTQVPKNLILILPRWQQPPIGKVFPNLHIDLTDVLEYASRICHMCGEVAMFECPECFDAKSLELSSATFCEPCSKTIHKHSKRADHMPVQLKVVDNPSNIDCPILRLVGMTLLQDSHYTSLSEPFLESIKRLSESQVLADETEWLSYNSKANLQDDGSYLPTVDKVLGISGWLSMNGYEQMARDMHSIPAHILPLLTDCCVCFYTQA